MNNRSSMVTNIAQVHTATMGGALRYTLGKGSSYLLDTLSRHKVISVTIGCVSVI